MNQLVTAVLSKTDLLEAQELINTEKQKVRDLVMKINEGKLNNKEIIDEILELDVSAGVEYILSCEV